MGTVVEAFVAQDTFCNVVGDLPVLHFQRLGLAEGNACTAVDTGGNGLGVVTVLAVKVAALQKDGSAVAGAVHGAEGNDLVDDGCGHLTAPVDPESCSSWQRPDPDRWYSDARSDLHPAFPSRCA